ncbi:MAG: phenylalanine--tRNA ligase subunit beta [Gammaproteobacteria bacterium]|nr:phenylalanine--tRNA ligase subunit beta [Gammaproteobacteria bacterium]
MKFSELWLREWVSPKVSSHALGDQLTMAGLEIDAIAPVAGTFSGVVVGRVLAIEPHPEADRLQVCTVDVGGAEPLQIVCGAKNVAVDMRVPAALVGASLPGGLKIKEAKLRGVPSFGMLCSAQELGLAEQASGLLPLDGDAIPGTDVRDCLQLDDLMFEIGLTPNRGDCLSISGIAREVGTINRLAVSAPDCAPVEPECDDRMEVRLEAGQDCPRYAGRVIKGIKKGAATPLWMQERLRRSGVRSLGPVVDVTNYVMLELGQPMHAFDLACLNGPIRVCHAQPGSEVALLDGRTVQIEDNDTLVIADRDRNLALAGIMGGQGSAVQDDTADLFLEAAHFIPAAISGKARQHGLHTDSSHRFERGVDPELPVRAVERATALLISIVGGAPGPVTDVRLEGGVAPVPSIYLRSARARKLLGIQVSDEEIEEILSRLGLSLEVIRTGEWRVTVPSYRFDLRCEADLIEEIVRIKGYDQLPDCRPLIHSGVPPLPSHVERGTSRIRYAMIERGYHEAICYSFVGEDQQRRFDPDLVPLTLANPLAADLAVMRTSLWPGLVTAALYNQRRQQPRVRLFEIGHRFLKLDNQEISEEDMLAGIVWGPLLPSQWSSEVRAADFYDIKGDLEALFPGLEYVPAERPALHPGRSARIVGPDGTEIGWIGTMHPETQRAADMASGEVVLFELRLSAVLRDTHAMFRELSRYPSVRRDLALLVPETVLAEQIRKTVYAAAGSLLTEFEIFDVYQGERIDSGLKSVAIGLTMQEISRTLTDDEVEGCMREVVDRLQAEHQARLRDR